MDRNRKCWDPRAPMIWNNFLKYFWTKLAILTTNMRSDPRTSRGLSPGCCHVASSTGESCEILLRIFLSDCKEKGREEESGLLYNN